MRLVSENQFANSTPTRFGYMQGTLVADNKGQEARSRPHSAGDGLRFRQQLPVRTLADSAVDPTQKPKAKSSKPASEQTPITWNDVTASYERVLDYVCVYEKEERAISEGEKQTIRLFFRKPLDVRLEWLNDRGNVDQTAVYRQGLNDGKVLARQSGLLGALAGKLRLDPIEPSRCQIHGTPLPKSVSEKLFTGDSRMRLIPISLHTLTARNRSTGEPLTSSNLLRRITKPWAVCRRRARS